VLANIFVEYHEDLLFDSITKPYIYQGYVDDTFTIFKMERDNTVFYKQLNSLQTSLKITMEKEKYECYHFLRSKLIKELTLLFTVNLLSLAKTHARTRSDLPNVKPTSLPRYIIHSRARKSISKINSSSRSLIASDLYIHSRRKQKLFGGTKFSRTFFH